MRAIVFLLSIFIVFDTYAQQNNPRLMQDTLQDVVIKSKTAKRILHSAKEYVVDYDFVADKVLVASYSGNNAKLFLLNKDGTLHSLPAFLMSRMDYFKAAWVLIIA